MEGSSVSGPTCQPPDVDARPPHSDPPLPPASGVS